MENNYGLSKKTNVAIAAIAGIGVVKDFPIAIAAIVAIALFALTYQFCLDRGK